MPMKIVTHRLTQKDFQPNGETEYIKIDGYVPTLWERIKARLRGNVKIHKHSSAGERPNLR